MGFTNKIGGGKKNSKSKSKKNSTSKKRSVSKATQTNVLQTVLEDSNKNQSDARVARRLARKNARRTARRNARQASFASRQEVLNSIYRNGEAYERQKQENANRYEEIKQEMIKEHGPDKAAALLKKLNNNMAKTRNNMLKNNEFRRGRIANWEAEKRRQERARRSLQERANYAAKVRMETFGHGPIPKPPPGLLEANARLQGHALAVQQYLAQQNGSDTEEEDEEERDAKLHAEA
jgi:hypothetical protein